MISDSGCVFGFMLVGLYLMAGTVAAALTIWLSVCFISRWSAMDAVDRMLDHYRL